MMNKLFVIFTGFAGGFAVGGGFVAFITVLGVIPRLIQITRGMFSVKYFEKAAVFGCIIGCLISIFPFFFTFPKLIIVLVGLLCGMFIGMLAAALTEVLNVFPILTKRLGIFNKMWVLLMAIIIGKIVGSLFYWLYFIEILQE